MHQALQALRTPRLRTPLHALALACAMLSSTAPAGAAAVVEGSVSLSDAGSFAGGVGDFLFPNSNLWAGFAAINPAQSATGRVTFNGGSLAQFRSITTAQPQNASTATPLGGFNVIRVEGAGTRLFTQGVSTGMGSGDIYVNSGALLDARSTACADNSFGFFFCSSRIGNTPGFGASLEVSGAGSTYLTRAMSIASVGVGTPGEQVGASVDVLAGGSLRSWKISTDGGPISVNAPMTGGETALGIARIRGANSLWVVDGFNSATDGSGVVTGANTAPSVIAGSFAAGTGKIFIEDGGTLRIEKADALSNAPFIIIGNGGTGEMRVTGAGSKLEVMPGTGGASMQLGRRAGSTGTLDVDTGGVVTGMQYMAVGRALFSNNVLDAGGTGRLIVDGSGSLLRLDDSTANNVGALDIARGAGATGTVTVRNGGRIEILGNVARTNGPSLLVGREAGDAGLASVQNTFSGSATLNIQGAGSVVELRADNLSNGANPVVRVGRSGTGTGSLSITAGGKLIIEGNAASTQASPRSTSFIVGGSANFGTLTGGNGSALISGAGSEVLMKGNDRFISVGDGPGAVGQLTIGDGGKLTGTLFHVGRVRDTSGTANGTVVMNNGQLRLEGVYNSSALGTSLGSSLVVGTDAGSVGSFTMSNASTVQVLTTEAGRSASVFVGSSPSFSGGVGSLMMSSGSSINVDGAGGSNFGIGTNGGTGSLTMNGSSITMAANGRANINGSALLANGSSFSAGSFFGLAATAGSTGSLILNDSTVTATDIVIGAGGYLGGSNGTLVGNVVNFGTVNPGNSPGTLTIQGNYKAEAGSRLVLEVDSDGSGGFRTDKLIFGGAVDLNGLDIEFMFLGDTDPFAFAASGMFQIDTFLRTGNDGSGTLDDSAFANVEFFASAAPGYSLNNFSFDPGTGPNLAPIPEPSTWALMLGGLAAVGWARRRQVTGAAVR